MPNKKLCITFAGAVGSSKTPIANYLSPKLNLPIFNNDAIRSEIVEDLGNMDAEEYIQRRNERLKEIVTGGMSFIYDASADREWKNNKQVLLDAGYEVFIISLDLSKELLTRLYKAKGYFETLERIDKLFNDHQVFLNEFSEDVGVNITDTEFKDRLEISLKAIKNKTA